MKRSPAWTPVAVTSNVVCPASKLNIQKLNSPRVLVVTSTKQCCSAAQLTTLPSGLLNCLVRHRCALGWLMCLVRACRTEERGCLSIAILFGPKPESAIGNLSWSTANSDGHSSTAHLATRYFCRGAPNGFVWAYQNTADLLSETIALFQRGDLNSVRSTKLPIVNTILRTRRSISEYGSEPAVAKVDSLAIDNRRRSEGGRPRNGAVNRALKTPECVSGQVS